jgi:hypothetical protein
LVFRAAYSSRTLTIPYFYSTYSAYTKWLTLHADAVDLDVDEVTEAVAVVDLAEEAARTRRKNGTCL